MENLTQFPNPLLDHHRATDDVQAVETISFASAGEIVHTFGHPQLEYAALHKACGLMDLPHRGVLELTGPDRHSFLNGLLSNKTYDKDSKSRMPAGSSVYAFFLNHKGRIVCDVNVLDLPERTLLEMDVRLVESVRAVFDQYLFAEKVKMKSLVGEVHQVGLYGPGMSAVVGETPDVCEMTIAGVDCVAWSDAPTGTRGKNLLVPAAAARALWDDLVSRFEQNQPPGRRAMRRVGWAAFNSCRIEAGRPLFGIDFQGVPPATASPSKKQQQEAESTAPTSGVLPAETGVLFARAVNLSKCYVGQEIVARMHARQAVARQIVGVMMESDALPLAGTPIQDAEGNTIGIVTSSTLSPVLGNKAICLAFVKRPHFSTGTSLSIAAEGAMRTGAVVALPFQR